MAGKTKLALVLGIVLVILVIIISYSAYVVVQPKQSSNTSSGYIEAVDFINRTVKVPNNVSRIVALGPGMLRLVTYLNATDLLVGVEASEQLWDPLGRDYAIAYAELFKKLPVVGLGGPRNPPDPEKIRSVSPDLVIVHKLYAQMYDPDRLSREVGTPVIVLDYGRAGYLDIDSIKKALKLLGEVLHREERADELCRYIDELISDLKKRTEGIKEKPSIYVGAVSYKGRQPFTSSQSPFPPLTLLNTSSIVDEVAVKPGLISVDFEYLLRKQPDIIFIDLNNLDIVAQDFKKDSSKYCALKAFREGRVCTILPFNYYHTNIATALADAYYIGKVLYPSKFADVDPVKKANEIFKVFLGKPLYDEFVRGYGIGFSNIANMFRCS